MSYIDEVREFVVENYLYGEDDGLEGDTSFLGTGIVDSTGILELVDFIESKYEVQVEDEDMVPENLDSLNNVASFVERKLADKITA
jgi:acyl carrier protein